MKRWSCLLAGIMLLALLAVPVRAQETAQMSLTPSANSAEAGEEIAVTVSVKGTQPCKAYGLMLRYDAEVFELVSGKCAVKGAMIATFMEGKGFAVLQGSASVPDGTLGTVTFRVKEDAPSGAAEISGTPSMKNGSQVIDCTVTAAQITIGSVPAETTEATVGETEETVAPTTKPATKPNQSSVPQKETVETELLETQTAPTALETVETEPAETVMEIVSEPAAVMAAPEAEPEEENGSAWLLPTGVVLAGAAILFVLGKKKR